MGGAGNRPLAFPQEKMGGGEDDHREGGEEQTQPQPARQPGLGGGVAEAIDIVDIDGREGMDGGSTRGGQ